MKNAQLHLKPGREIPILRGHPWIMSGAIARTEGLADTDETDVLAANGAFMGRATVHPSSEIRARLFACEPGARLDAAGIRERLRGAIERRRRWVGAGPDGAERLVFSESDGLPGLIVDRYKDVLVLQLLTAPWESRREALIAALQDLVRPATIWERSDVDARRHEDLEPRKGLLAGAALNGPVEFREDRWSFLADVENGHKTGFYLDQRTNRQALAGWVRRLGRPRVLNVFAYTDSFGICALEAGADQVLSLDSSSGAMDLAARQLALNPAGAPERRDYRLGDAFEQLRSLRDQKARFDLVILDPPKLVNRKSKLHPGLRAYKDINLLALQLLNAGGLLFSCSCSGLVDRELFGKVIEGAARDAKRPAQFLADLGQPPDHPRKPGFAESEYLKGFVVGV
jgi:23S rRNA (cytosine1962-C5)-methyltransferase